jgi:hypothetical protein
MAEAVAAGTAKGVQAAGADKPRQRRLRVFMETRRKDNWWVPQLITFVVFTSFIVYATWAAFQGEHYTSGPYLSPFYAPELWGTSHHAWFGPPPDWIPAWIPFTPALLILPFPGGFRFTCYYYRGAYYKAFWADPPGCAVGEPRGKSFLGENSLPLILQNVHRYFMYAAVVFIFLLSYDVFLATQFEDGFGIGVGTIIMFVNVCLLASYTFGCHSLRHLLGGNKDNLPKGGVGQACYDGCSKLNTKHQLFAWCSLFSVALTDVYIRLCSMGVIHDFRIF